MKRPWYAVSWFSFWGLFQAYAVTSVLQGRWERPEAFPEEAYNALAYPGMVFIPLYLATAGLLAFGRREGLLLGLFVGGAVTYVMVYLLALARFEGTENLIADLVFLALNAAAVLQLARWLLQRPAA